jgi:hypothetical protein
LFDERNGKLPFNASGVVQVGRHRFIFVDNHDPTSLFELVLDDGTEAERIQRRVLAGVMDGELRDPEGLTRLDHDGEIFLIASSSLCAAGTVRSDGLVRARHTATWRPKRCKDSGPGCWTTSPGSPHPPTRNQMPAG